VAWLANAANVVIMPTRKSDIPRLGNKKPHLFKLFAPALWGLRQNIRVSEPFRRQSFESLGEVETPMDAPIGMMVGLTAL
jgi:hypothetical protein